MSALAIEYGDYQFSQALEASIVNSANQIYSHFSGIDFPFVDLHDCYSSNAYKFPSKSEAHGRFKTLLEKQSLRVGVLNDTIFSNNFLNVIPIVVKQMELNYNVEFQVTYVNEDDASKLIRLLKNGDIDFTAPSFFLGGFTHDRLVDFGPTCAVQAWSPRFIVTTESNITDFKQLQLVLLKPENKKKLVVFSAPEKELVSKVLKMSSALRDSKEISDIFSEMESGDILAFLDQSGQLDNDILSEKKMTFFDSKFVLPAYMLSKGKADKKLVDTKTRNYDYGNSQLRAYFDYAISAFQIKKEYNKQSVIVGDCFTSVPSIPDELLAGTALLVRERRSIAIGRLELISEDDKFAADYILGKVSQRMKIIGADIEVVTFLYSNQDDLFTALMKGEIDATSPIATGGTHNGKPIKWEFQPSCSVFGKQLNFYVPTSAKIFSYMNFLSSIEKNQGIGVRIIAVNNDVKTVAQRGLFEKAPKIEYITASLLDGFKMIANNTAFAFFPGFDYEAGSNPTLEANTVLLQSEELVNYAMFFRRDSLECVGTACPYRDHSGIVSTLSAVLFVLILAIACFAIYAGYKALKERRTRREQKKEKENEKGIGNEYDEQGSYQPVLVIDDL